jgi:hypothetical protein
MVYNTIVCSVAVVRKRSDSIEILLHRNNTVYVRVTLDIGMKPRRECVIFYCILLHIIYYYYRGGGENDLFNLG